MNDHALIAALVQRITLLRPLVCLPLPDGVAQADLEPIVTGKWSTTGCARWKPGRVDLTLEALRDLHDLAGGPLPPAYELLIRSFCFASAEVMSFRLLGNWPPGPLGLINSVKADPVLFKVLSEHGMFHFGRHPNSYDPLCFDLRQRAANGECPVVRFDHEIILGEERLGSAMNVADSFRELVERELAVPPPQWTEDYDDDDEENA